MERILLQAGIRALKELGYHKVNQENIFSDENCRALFLCLLKNTRTDAAEQEDIIAACDALIAKTEGYES